MNSHIRFIAIGAMISLAAIVTIPITTYAIGVPVGGVITFMQPCIGTGYSKGIIAQSPPRPPIPVIFMPTIFPYYMPIHPGQFVLGILGPVGACTLVVDAAASFLPVMTFYGTSR